MRGAVEKYPQFASLFGKLQYGDSTMLDKIFYDEEVKRNVLMFEQQFHYGVFYGARTQKPPAPGRALPFPAPLSAPGADGRFSLAGGFAGYLRLREQEIRNLMWVAECVSQDQKSRVHEGIVLTV